MRRVVTGVGTDGRSTVLSDGEPALIYRFGTPSDPHSAVAERIDTFPEAMAPAVAAVAELWSTDQPVPASDAADPTVGVDGWDVECPPGTTKWRMVRYGADLYAPLHRTNTLDFDVVLEGEVTLLLEDGSEVLMRPGDSVLIPGVVHGWRAGPSGCAKAVVMTGYA